MTTRKLIGAVPPTPLVPAFVGPFTPKPANSRFIQDRNGFDTVRVFTSGTSSMEESEALAELIRDFLNSKVDEPDAPVTPPVLRDLRDLRDSCNDPWYEVTPGFAVEAESRESAEQLYAEDAFQAIELARMVHWTPFTLAYTDQVIPEHADGNRVHDLKLAEIPLNAVNGTAGVEYWRLDFENDVPSFYRFNESRVEVQSYRGDRWAEINTTREQIARDVRCPGAGLSWVKITREGLPGELR